MTKKNVLVNSNFIIIFLILVFLFLRRILDMEILYRLYDIMYTLVIPFIIFSFSRILSTKDRKYKQKLIKNSVLIYVFIKCLIPFFDYFIDKEFILISFLSNKSIEWIFIAIPIYLLLIDNIDLNKIKENVILFSVIGIILQLTLPVETLTIAIVATFLPFFILGQVSSDEKVSYIKIIIIFIVLSIIQLITFKFNVNIASVMSINDNNIEFIVNKIILYIIAFTTIPICMMILRKFNFLDREIIKTFKGNKNKKEKEIINNRNTNIVSKILTSDFIVVLFIIIILLKTIFFYKTTLFGGEKIWRIFIYYNLYFILLLSIPLILIRNGKNRFIFFIILDFLISLILFADSMYYQYSHIMISINQIYNLKYVKEISETSADLIRIKDLVYFIDIVVLIILSIVSKIKTTQKKGWVYRFLLSTVIINISIVNINFRVLIDNINAMPYNNTSQVSKCSIYGYHLYDIIKFYNIKESIKYKNNKEINTAVNEINEEYKTKYEGIASGKNIIIIQLEAIQNFLYHAEINGKEIIPNMSKFIDENIYISNMHAQSYSTTADSEFSAITSLYPLDNGLSFSKYYGVEYEDMFSKLKEKDYYTSFIHGNKGDFWNRENAYANFGVDDVEFIDKSNDKKSLIMGYLSDELLYKEAIEEIRQYSKPYCLNLVTASSHTPFTLDGLENKENVLTIDVGKYKGTRFGNYLESVNYADIQFGKFIENLKANGIYDDTVIFIYGDHYGMTMDDENMLEFLSNEMKENMNEVKQKCNFTNVLCGLKVPNILDKKIDKPVSKIDVKPTILSLIGIDEEFSIGTSVFSNKEYVSISNGTIVTLNEYYDSKDWYEIDSGKIIDLDNLDEMKKEKFKKYVENMRKELDISNAYPIINR